MKQSNINKQLEEYSSEEAELLKKLEEVRSKKESIAVEQKKLDERAKVLEKSLQDPNNIILGINKKSEFLAEVTREYFGVDSNIADSIMMESLKSRLIEYQKSSTVISGQSILDDVERTASRHKAKNPLVGLKGFNFRKSNAPADGENSGLAYRKRTPSQVYVYNFIDGHVKRMSDGTNKEETTEYFNRWKLSDILPESLEKKFKAYNKTTGEYLYDTINTLNPNIIIITLKNGTRKAIVPASNNYSGVNVLEGDCFNLDGKYMTTKQYFSALLICMREYFGSDFTDAFADMVDKFSSVNADELGKSKDKENYLVYKYFTDRSSKWTNQASIARGRRGYVYMSSSNYLEYPRKRMINSYIRCFVEAIAGDKADEFYDSVEFYGVFDEVSQGDYSKNKENYFHSF